MKSRSPLLLVALFVVPFLAAMVAAFTWRTNQIQASPSTDVVVETDPPAETTTTQAPPETLAPIESTVAPTEAPVETTEPPTTTTAPAEVVAPDAPVTTSGAMLSGQSEQKNLDPAVGCSSLARFGATLRDCQTSESNGVEIAWVSMDEGLDIFVRRPDEVPDVWNLALRSSSAPSRNPIVDDVTGDETNDLVFGVRTSGKVEVGGFGLRNTGKLEVDVVEFGGGSPNVTLHLSLADGRVQAGAGSLDAWSVVDGNEATYVHWGYSGGGGNWLTTADLTNEPPQGQL